MKKLLVYFFLAFIVMACEKDEEPLKLVTPPANVPKDTTKIVPKDTTKITPNDTITPGDTTIAPIDTVIVPIDTPIVPIDTPVVIAPDSVKVTISIDVPKYWFNGKLLSYKPIVMSATIINRNVTPIKWAGGNDVYDSIVSFNVSKADADLYGANVEISVASVGCPGQCNSSSEYSGDTIILNCNLKEKTEYRGIKYTWHK
ncbi:MAG: hypothetical protein WC458_01105 [Patescibacteria group bacterium]